MKQVTILMATYNGEEYVREQIDSILNQTYKNIKLIICDDCSSDNTFSILKDYEARFLDKITVYKTEHNTGSAKSNFLGLMLKVKDEYMMLSDQDDIWLPNKIELTMNKIHEMEEKYGEATPLLVHTDLKVVDEKLNTISESFIKAMNADYSKTALNQQIIQNTLTGCTALYNKALAELIAEEPRYCVMHDWWLNLIASAFGHIDYIKDQTILYRQHGKNEVGAKDMSGFVNKFKIFVKKDNIIKAIIQTYKQADSFLEIYSSKLSKNDINLLEAYIDIPRQNKIKRCFTILRLGTLKNGFARRLGQFLFI